jgi:hypothetical protein
MTGDQNVSPPRLVLQIPTHRSFDALIEGDRRRPVQISANLGGVDCVTTIMARAVGNIGDLVGVKYLGLGS